MFEQSLLGVSGRERRRGTGIILGSVVVQVVLLTSFVVEPLLYPAALPAYRAAESKTVSLVRVKPQPIVIRKPVIVRETASTAAPVTDMRQASQPSAVASLRPAIFVGEVPVSIGLGDGPHMTGSTSLPGLGLSAIPGSGDKVVAKAAVSGPINVSRGVSAGLLLTPLRPIYPEIARMARVSGTVVVTATIDKTGRIVGLQVLSGPVMLQKAAADSVRDARYRPYLLNGQPVEVVTTFSVNFVMG